MQHCPPPGHPTYTHMPAWPTPVPHIFTHLSSTSCMNGSKYVLLRLPLYSSHTGLLLVKTTHTPCQATPPHPTPCHPKTHNHAHLSSTSCMNGSKYVLLRPPLYSSRTGLLLVKTTHTPPRSSPSNSRPSSIASATSVTCNSSKHSRSRDAAVLRAIVRMGSSGGRARLRQQLYG
jgi:hypothetical protein